MITRLSKIARLPAKTREQLNRRLHDGQLSRTILPWVNNLPKTKKVMTELFGGKPITHQNLSEWRRTGYQDWLFHQQRIDWFDRLTEEESDIQKHDKCNDTFEAMSNYFLFELGHAVRALQTIKNPFERMERMQHLSREFARLQNAFNWSRRVQLEWDKANHRLEPKPYSGTGVSPVRPKPAPPAPVAPKPPESESGQPAPVSTSSFCTPPSAFPNAGGASVPASRSPALPDAPRITKTQGQRASVSDCGSPLPLSEQKVVNSEPKHEESKDAVPDSSFCLQPSSFPPKCQPLPPLAPPMPAPLISTPDSYLQTPNSTPPPRPLKGVHPPIRGRRFVCIEG